MWVSAGWSPPPTSVRSTGVRVGREAIEAAGESLRPRQSSEPGWVLWAAAPGREGQVVAFKDRKLSA